MSINYSSLIIKKGLDTENLKNLIFKFSTNLIVEFEDFNDFNLFHENTFNSYVNLKNKSIVILSNKLTNSEINKFSFSEKRKDGVTIDDISDEDGWKVVKADLLRNVGTNSIPVIFVEEIEDGMLVLRHEHDGRDLDLEHAEKVVEHAKTLWGSQVKLYTDIEDELWEI